MIEGEPGGGIVVDLDAGRAAGLASPGRDDAGEPKLRRRAQRLGESARCQQREIGDRDDARAGIAVERAEGVELLDIGPRHPRFFREQAGAAASRLSSIRTKPPGKAQQPAKGGSARRRTSTRGVASITLTSTRSTVTDGRW